MEFVQLWLFPFFDFLTLIASMRSTKFVERYITLHRFSSIFFSQKPLSEIIKFPFNSLFDGIFYKTYFAKLFYSFYSQYDIGKISFSNQKKNRQLRYIYNYRIAMLKRNSKKKNDKSIK